MKSTFFCMLLDHQNCTPGIFVLKANCTFSLNAVHWRSHGHHSLFASSSGPPPLHSPPLFPHHPLLPLSTWRTFSMHLKCPSCSFTLYYFCKILNLHPTSVKQEDIFLERPRRGADIIAAATVVFILSLVWTIHHHHHSLSLSLSEPLFTTFIDLCFYINASTPYDK